ncbi:MAG: GGDEF domain-containing protein [Spirochaetes bacterium]|nr:MAG: GGDEF domain-containing protein [Spirochaetota bacterium]
MENMLSKQEYYVNQAARVLPSEWERVMNSVEFAFQPIVNPLTGITFGLEALVRGTERAGFASIQDMFDTAFREGTLFGLDIRLRILAIERFGALSFHRKVKLFYNYDPRVHEMSDYTCGITEQILADANLDHSVITFEISERYKVRSDGEFMDFLALCRKRGFKIAIDDFGAGFSGFELFYYSEPDFLKFDRFLISGIDSDVKKRTFCAHILSLARLFGVVSIAEGIETEKEFRACSDLGFDLVQGYYIAQPAHRGDGLAYAYGHVRELALSNRRAAAGDAGSLRRQMIPLETIGAGDGMEVIFKRFNRNSGSSFFPVLDGQGFPLGILHERKIKKFVYSPFGYDLLIRKRLHQYLESFMEKCPIVDINTPQEKILEVFVNNPGADGVIITEDLQYRGFLTSTSLLHLINEQNLALARELNPLTKLPGNILVTRFITDTLERGVRSWFIYFDLDNFKPFNDRFGFRQGDRAIVLFGDILRKHFTDGGCFAGHIGGDDFFVGVRGDEGLSADAVRIKVSECMEEFNLIVATFYEAQEIASGYYGARDRYGTWREFPLLTVSAAVLEVEEGCGIGAVELVFDRLARLKRQVKGREKEIPSYHSGEWKSVPRLAYQMLGCGGYHLTVDGK